MSSLGSRKASWSRRHSDGLKGGDGKGCPWSGVSFNKGLGRGLRVTVWRPECKAKVCVWNTRGSALRG